MLLRQNSVSQVCIKWTSQVYVRARWRHTFRIRVRSTEAPEPVREYRHAKGVHKCQNKEYREPEQVHKKTARRLYVDYRITGSAKTPRIKSARTTRMERPMQVHRIKNAKTASRSMESVQPRSGVQRESTHNQAYRDSNHDQEYRESNYDQEYSSVQYRSTVTPSIFTRIMILWL